MTDVPEEGQKRRSFFKACMAVIGGLISLAMAVPLIGFAISPAFRKTSKNGWTSVLSICSRGVAIKKLTTSFKPRMVGLRRIKNVLSM